MAPSPFPELLLLRILNLSLEISNKVDNHPLPRQSIIGRESYSS
jgi:hypothetical protein